MTVWRQDACPWCERQTMQFADVLRERAPMVFVPSLRLATERVVGDPDARARVLSAFRCAELTCGREVLG